ncbi:MAG TPA: reverse transcriptase family protein [Tepidisphaeraceae bacterium]|nr:reverse transcriptase family protein [Tepidisphaeraceae bacterium]
MGHAVLVIAICIVLFWVVAALVDRAQRRKRRDARLRRVASGKSPTPMGEVTAWPPAAGRASSPAKPSPSAPSSRPAPPAPIARPAARLELDAGMFQPITGQQASQEARGVGWSWASAFFGRRDIIPPADDPRTSIIDRGMVGRGLITPEELVEIHAIGRQMDEVRPNLAHAVDAADRAARDDKEARAKLKEQKKAEAAERKRLHAEAVARRKATDIVFLGRGVSKGLADRRSHVEKLRAAGLPILSAPADVAAALGVTVPRLRWLAYHADASPVSHYVRFTVKKRSGGERLLSAPMDELARAQAWILASVLQKIPTHAAAHGFVAGRSTVSNATPHVGRDVLVNADLKDFFPSVTFRRVAGLFRELGYSPAVATVFALLCTDAPRRKVLYASKPFWVAAGARQLPQGACTSPAISNLVARRLDSRLAGIAVKLGWTYTRYADDLSFSADGEPSQRIGYLLARVRHISQDEGFAVNEAKTRVLRQSTRQLVTGVVVNDRPGVDRATVRRLRAILHRAKSEGLAAQNRERVPHFEAWLDGMIAYIHMVNPQQAEPLRRAFDAVRRP